MPARRRVSLGLLALACVLLAPARARASYEEFQTLDVARQEEDDENLLDHVLARPPEGWREEWLGARGAFRSSQGCFTSGQWYLDHELRVRVPMGDTTAFVLGIREVTDDESTFGWTDFTLWFPVRHAGLWGVSFRPVFDKSKQDAALHWSAGTSASPFELHAVFGLEDVFNKFWALRQTRVGDAAEPYEKHPYEPALRVVWRGAGPYVELNGKWLTASRKRFETRDREVLGRERLWGVKHDATLSQPIGPGRLTLRFEQLQASSYEYALPTPAGDSHVYRRRWLAEAAWSQPVGAHGRVTARWFHQRRDQVWRPPVANASIRVVDQMPMLEGSFRVHGDLHGRAGFMRARIRVMDDGRLPVFTWGSRSETRAFVSLYRQFGRVRLEGTECIELDHEQYDVAFHHDKGFIHIQTTF